VKALDPDDPAYAEMLNRLERVMNAEISRDTDDLFRKFRYFQNRELSPKQRILLSRYAKQKGIPTARKPRPIGISRRRGVSRVQLKRHYTVHEVRGKTVVVARIPKGMKGAGRFAKRG
jgi:hypothetical protein